MSVSSRAHGLRDPSSGKPDDSTHDYCFLPSTYGTENDAFRDSMMWGMNRLDAQTTLADQHDSPCTDNTDIRFGRTTTLEAYTLASWQCLDLEAGNRCNRSTIQVDIEEHYRYGNDPDNLFWRVGWSDGGRGTGSKPRHLGLS